MKQHCHQDNSGGTTNHVNSRQKGLVFISVLVTRSIYFIQYNSNLKSSMNTGTSFIQEKITDSDEILLPAPEIKDVDRLDHWITQFSDFLCEISDQHKIPHNQLPKESKTRNYSAVRSFYWIRD